MDSFRLVCIGYFNYSHILIISGCNNHGKTGFQCRQDILYTHEALELLYGNLMAHLLSYFKL